jgi:hypothetical protein
VRKRDVKYSKRPAEVTRTEPTKRYARTMLLPIGSLHNSRQILAVRPFSSIRVRGTSPSVAVRTST